MVHFAGSTGSRTRFQTKVLLHIYDLSPANDYLWQIGCGLHHSGIEVMGIEYSFASGAGIYESNTPTIVVGAKYRERVELGSFDGGSERLKQVLDELKDHFGPEDYNIIRRNCNHFANALAWKLLQRKVPPYVNRASDLAQCLSCLIPRKLLENAPVGDPNQGKDTNSFGSSSILNQRQTSSSKATFSGAGRRLTGDSPSAVSERSGLLSRFGNPAASASGSSTDDLTDRREKMRKAALARLELSQLQEQGEKQS